MAGQDILMAMPLDLWRLHIERNVTEENTSPG
jgi:hypothetical protein